MTGATAISSNGKYVVGVSPNGGMRWSEAEGSVPLTDVYYPRGVSADGQTVVGNGRGGGEGAPRPQIWVNGKNYSSPGAVTGTGPPIYWDTTLNAVSDSGFRVIGTERGRGQDVMGAALWLGTARVEPTSSGEGFIGWPISPGSTRAYEGLDMSFTGNTVLGSSESGAVIWRTGQDLGTLQGLTTGAHLQHLSPNGRYAVGRGVLYDIDGKVETRFTTPGLVLNDATGVSNNKRVVGNVSDNSMTRPFYWDDGLSTAIDLKGYLINQPGLSPALQGWTLTGASDISADGRTIVGTGINPQGQQQAWIADIAKYVVLNFGQATPGQFKHTPTPTDPGFHEYIPTGSGLGSLAVAPNDQQTLVEEVQAIFDRSGVKNIEVTTDQNLQATAVNVYFASQDWPNEDVAGASLTEYLDPVTGTQVLGINRHATTNTGNVIVFPKAFAANAPPRDFGGLEFVSETIAHEVGHALGLMHVDLNGPFGPNAGGSAGGPFEVMERGARKNDPEQFHNAEMPIMTGGLPVQNPFSQQQYTSNPLFGLRHFVDGIPESALIAQGAQQVLPGHLEGDAILFINGEFLEFFAPDRELYNVQLLLGLPLTGESGYVTVKNVPVSTISQVGNLLKGLPLGSAFKLLAATEQGGALDVGIATLDDDGLGSVEVPLTGYFTEFALTKFNTDGTYMILATGSFGQVPEPSCIMLALFGVVCTRLRWRR